MLVLVILGRWAILLSTQHLLHHNLKSVGQGWIGNLGKALLGSPSPLYTTRERITWIFQGTSRINTEKGGHYFTEYSLLNVSYLTENNEVHVNTFTGKKHETERSIKPILRKTSKIGITSQKCLSLFSKREGIKMTGLVGLIRRE